MRRICSLPIFGSAAQKLNLRYTKMRRRVALPGTTDSYSETTPLWAVSQSTCARSPPHACNLPNDVAEIEGGRNARWALTTLINGAIWAEGTQTPLTAVPQKTTNGRPAGDQT